MPQELENLPAPEAETSETPTETNLPWLAERLERARRAAQQHLLDTLGYAAIEDVQRDLSTLEALQTEREILQNQLAEAESARHNAYLEAAFLHHAGRYPFHDLHEARLLIDLSGITWGDDSAIDGKIKIEGMAEAVAALVKQRPHLLRRTPTPITDAPLGGQRRGGFTPNSVQDLPAEQVAALKRRFKLP